MMKKKFDCVEFQRNIRDEFWIEGGCTIDGLIKLHNQRINNNELLKKIVMRKKSILKQSNDE